MRPLRDQPIKRKLVLLTTLTCTIALLLASASFFITAREEIKDNLATLAGVMGENSVAALAFDDSDAAEETLMSLRAVDNLVAAAIYSEDGSLFATYIHESAPYFLPPKPLEAGHQYRDQHLDLFRPILLNGEKIGVVYLQADLRVLYARLYQYALIVVIVMLVSSLVAFVLSSVLQRTISKPIQNLVQTARAVSEHKDYSLRAEVESQDELGMLTEQFNDMLTKIQVRDAALDDQAKEMTRLKTSFLSNLSHEIRTPIAGILGCADVLIEETADSVREFAQMIRQSGQRLLDTLNSVLDLSRLEAREVKPNYELLDLRQEIHQMVHPFVPRARQKGLTLEIRHGEEPAWLKLDRACLNKILNNLIDNAIKFSNEGSIDVEVVVDEAWISITFRDRGVGISREFLPQIFDEFKQESTGHDRAQEGMGLGLTITKKLVELMDGKIKVESVKGLGSMFTVSFARPIERGSKKALELGAPLPPHKSSMARSSRSDATARPAVRSGREVV